MTNDEGKIMHTALLDAIGMAEERVEDGVLMGIAIIMNVEDADGDVHMVTHTWPRASW